MATGNLVILKQKKLTMVTAMWSETLDCNESFVEHSQIFEKSRCTRGPTATVLILRQNIPSRGTIC
jgi:hypothetical protein